MKCCSIGCAWVGSLILAAQAAGDGGATCQGATVITQLPFQEQGTTCGLFNDYATSSCMGNDAGEDAVYVYTPTFNGEISISVCGASFNTKIYVFAGGCPSGQVVACSNSGCSANPGSPGHSINHLQVFSGVPYFIVIDSNFLPCLPSYTMTVQQHVAPTCLPEFLQDRETFSCVTTHGAGDFYNGGCGSYNPAFSRIQNGQSACGTLSAKGETFERDTDWYELHLSTSARITWFVLAEAQVDVGVPDNGGVSDCAGLQCFAEIERTIDSLPLTINLIRPPGDWWLYLAPPVGTDLDCGTKYIVSASVDPITPDIDGNAAVDGIDLGILLASWTSGSACNADDFCPADLNLDGSVDGVDLGVLLAAWNPS